MNLEVNNLISPSFTTAKNLARSLIKKTSIQKPPILIKTIFKSLPEKITISGKDLGTGDGFSSPKKITYNSTHPDTRIRFTIAHELGHILLGHNTSSRMIDLTTKEPKEELANVFAAELLVPLSLLKTENLLAESLSGLAKKYWVSNEVMMWRLRETKLDIKLGNWH